MIKQFQSLLYRLLAVVAMAAFVVTVADADTFDNTLMNYQDAQLQASQAPSDLYMMADVVAGRPLMAAGTIFSSALFVVSLPFSILGGNVGDAGQKMVVDPVNATFFRCLGCTSNNDQVYASSVG
ncbi:MAG: multidrug transporter [Legionellales bacterium]|nr:multidrug transporter [Legionellales bacterium]|tara:strand:+ start:4932 stop:5306 length:375 start_codon:yes stop_codon:yes gene_type:complete